MGRTEDDGDDFTGETDVVLGRPKSGNGEMQRSLQNCVRGDGGREGRVTEGNEGNEEGWCAGDGECKFSARCCLRVSGRRGTWAWASDWALCQLPWDRERRTRTSMSTSVCEPDGSGVGTGPQGAAPPAHAGGYGGLWLVLLLVLVLVLSVWKSEKRIRACEPGGPGIGRSCGGLSTGSRRQVRGESSYVLRLRRHFDRYFTIQSIRAHSKPMSRPAFSLSIHL